MRSDDDDGTDFERLSAKLLAFREAHPELNEALGTWIADRSTCEIVHPEAVEILRREMPEFASDANANRRSRPKADPR